MFSTVKCVLILATLANSELLTYNELKTIVNTLKAVNPILAHDKRDRKLAEDLAKALTKEGQTTRILPVESTPKIVLKQHLLTESCLWLSGKSNVLQDMLDNSKNNANLTNRVGINAPILVFVNNELEIPANLNIDQRIYFITKSNLTVFEAYSINQVDIRKSLGHFSGSGRSFRWLHNLMIKGDPLDFISQRSNFYGIQLKIVTEIQKPYIFFTDGYEQKAPNKTDIPETFDVTGMVYGMFFDILNIFQNELNFTTKLYKRFDGKWGSYNEETKKWNGMIRSIVDGQVDMAATSLAITLSRAAAVKYLPPVGSEAYSISILNPDAEESSWITYLIQFSEELWLAVLTMAFLIAIILCLAEEWRKKSHDIKLIESIQKFVGALWLGFSANFGGKPVKPPERSNWTGRILVFSCLLGGSVIFMSYRASMFVVLAMRIVKMPFNTPFELLKTDFRMSARPGGLTEDQFVKAEEGSPMDRIYKERMSPDDFIWPVEGIQRMKTDSRLAYFASLDTMVTAIVSENEKCTLVFPWISKFPFGMSMALPYGSPYYRFLHRNVYKIRENGALSIITQRWVEPIPKCPITPVRAITLKKIFTLFGVILVGLVGSCLVLFSELLWKPCSNQKYDSTTTGSIGSKKLDLAVQVIQPLLRVQADLSQIQDQLPPDMLDKMGVILKLVKDLPTGKTRKKKTTFNLDTKQTTKYISY